MDQLLRAGMEMRIAFGHVDAGEVKVNVTASGEGRLNDVKLVVLVLSMVIDSCRTLELDVKTRL